MTVIVNGDITQCDLPRGVCSGLSDALERFEEDEMVGIVRFGKRGLRTFGTLPTYATCLQLSVLSVQSPGEPGFVLRVYTRTSVFSETTIFYLYLTGEVYAHPVAFL